MLLVVVVAWAILGGRDSPNDEVGTTMWVSDGRLNEEIRVGDVGWTATAAQAFDAPGADDQSNENATIDGRVMRVDLAVHNYGKTSITVDDSFVTLVDSRSRLLNRYTGASLPTSGDEGVFHEKIGPGTGRIGHLDFELPRDASGLTLWVRSPARSNVVGFIDLGM